MRQQVVCVVPPGVSMFELATPIGVFGRDRAESNNLPIDFTLCGLTSEPVTVEDGIALSGLSKLDRAIETADMVIVPTWPIATSPIPGDLIDLLTDAHERGSRLVGLCLGAFAIAATGLLDSRTVTTHWRHRERFESRHPEVTFEPNSLYVDADTVVTSAGSAAALDCCIHLLRRDHGAHIAAQVAKSMVTAPHRSGSQSQFASTPSITVEKKTRSPERWQTRQNASPRSTTSRISPPSLEGVDDRSSDTCEGSSASPQRSGSTNSALSSHADCWKPQTCQWSKSPPEQATAQHHRCAEHSMPEETQLQPPTDAALLRNP